MGIKNSLQGQVFFGVYLDAEDLLFTIYTPNVTGDYSESTFTIASILDGDKSTLSTTTVPGASKEIIDITKIINGYGADKFLASKTLFLKFTGDRVYKFDLNGFGKALGKAFDYVDGLEDPFGGTDSEDPFGGSDDLTDLENFSARAEELNPFDLEGYIVLFTDFAAANGIDVKYIFKYDIDAEFTYEHMEEQTIAYTDSLGDDEKVHIAVNPDAWVAASPAKRVAVLFHELGHDVLNFKHSSDEGPLMSVYARSDYSIEEVFELTLEMFEDYKNGVEYNHENH